MSAWKRDLFKWHKSDLSNVDRSLEPLVCVGKVDITNPVAKSLHAASITGRKKEILRCLESGIFIDIPNNEGQTPLFCAALRGHYRIVELLLQNNANPNEKSNNGMTPVHVACLTANLRILGAMIEAGGDLRLHDNQRNTCLDWAKRQPDPRKRLKMLEFLQKSQLFALNYNTDLNKLGTLSLGGLDRQPSILQMLRNKVGSHISLDISGQDCFLRKIQSRGFGRVYYGGDAGGGVLSVIPLITDNLLREDVMGTSFQVSSSFIMASMLWNLTPVSVKKLDKSASNEGAVDLVISEVEYLRKLHHPNILLLMGLCQSSSLDNLMLVFERVGLGSLHFFLFEKMERLPMMYVRDIARQVGEALLYMHNQNLLHCGLSSHSVFLVTVYLAKIGGFEYVVERKKAEVGRSSTISVVQHKEQLYRWMAPEVMTGQPPSACSDIYSFSCILWEMIHSEMPWKSQAPEEIFQTVTVLKKSLSVDESRTPQLFRGILEKGLTNDPMERPTEFSVVLKWLEGPLYKAPGWKTSSIDQLMMMRRESDERIPIGGNFSYLDPNRQADFWNRESFSTDNGSFNESNSQQKESVANNIPFKSASKPASKVNSTETVVEVIKSHSSDTNNHYQARCPGKVKRTDSWSTLSDSGDSDDTMHHKDQNNPDKQHRMNDHKSLCSNDSKARSYTTRAHREGVLHKQGVPRHFERSESSCSTSQMRNTQRRSATLPWQGSLGLIRAGSSSPRLANRSFGQTPYVGSPVNEGDSKVLPLVKPASHCTDLKAFIQADPLKSTGSLPGFSKSKKVISNTPVGTRSNYSSKLISRPHSMCEQVSEAKAKDDMELRHHGSVRSLAEHFQTHLVNHSLRQSILRGSMLPHGTCDNELCLSPEANDFSSYERNTSPRTKKTDNYRKDSHNTSPKGSVDSLTTVSNQESTQDEEYTDPENEVTLHFSEGDSMVHFKNGILQNQSEFSGGFKFLPSSNIRKDMGLSSQSDNTRAAVSDPNEKRFTRTWGLITEDSLRPRVCRSDIFHENFDFHEYYIEDDFTVVYDEDTYKFTSPPSKSNIPRENTPSGDAVIQGLNTDHYEKSTHWDDSCWDQSVLNPSPDISYGWKESILYPKVTKTKRLKVNKNNKDVQLNYVSNKSQAPSQISYDLHTKKCESPFPSPNAVDLHIISPQNESPFQYANPYDSHTIFKISQNPNISLDPYDSNSVFEQKPNPSKNPFDSHISGHIQSPVSSPDHDSHNPRQSPVINPDTCSSCNPRQNLNTALSPKPFEYDMQASKQSQNSGQNTCPNEDAQDLPEELFYRKSELKSPTKDEAFDLWDSKKKRCIVLNLETSNHITDNKGYQEEREFNLEDPYGHSDDSGNLSIQDTPPKSTSNPHDTSVPCDIPASRDTPTPHDTSAPCDIPAPRDTTASHDTTIHKFYMKPSNFPKGYTTCVRVESSLQTPGSHHITHTAIDQATGIAHTVHEETIQAQTLRTTLGVE